jgi:hypothetical protein
MKLGNADGGKAATQLPPLLGTHLLHTEVDLHTEVGREMETKLVRIAGITSYFCEW